MEYEPARVFTCCGQYLIVTDGAIKYPICPRCGERATPVDLPLVKVVSRDK